MQTAYREVREQGNLPVQSLLTQPGHSVVLWTPETLDLSRKTIGLLKIEGRNFAVFYDQQILDRDQSETIFNDQTGAPRALTHYTKTAMACAVEVLIQFGARGVVILDSLLDRPQGALVQFEAKLVNAGWFDTEKNPQLDDLVAIINDLTAAGAWSDEKEAKAAEELLRGISTAIEYRATYADDHMGEAQRAREGKQGRANLTRQEQQYLAEIGFKVPTDVAALDIKKAAAKAAPEVQPAVVELVQASTHAVVSVFSDALQKLADSQKAQAEFFMEALSEIRGQRGPGTGNQSDGAGIINDAGQTIAHRDLPGHPGYVESYVADPGPAGQTAGVDGGHSSIVGQVRGSEESRIGGSAPGGPRALESDKEPDDSAGGIDGIIADAGQRVTGAANRGNKTAGGNKSGTGNKPGNRA